MTSWFLILHLVFPSPERSEGAAIMFYFNAAFLFGRQTPQIL